MGRINSSDPSLFQGINIQLEYRIAHDMMGINSEGLERIRQNGLLAAYLSDSERRILKKKSAKENKVEQVQHKKFLPFTGPLF